MPISGKKAPLCEDCVLVVVCNTHWNLACEEMMREGGRGEFDPPIHIIKLKKVAWISHLQFLRIRRRRRMRGKRGRRFK